MKAWRCSECSGMWGLALLRCPRCHTDTLEEENMPKISRAAGASIRDVAPNAVVKVKQVLTDREAKHLKDHIAEHGTEGELPFGATVEQVESAAAAEPASTPAAAADQTEGGEQSSVGSSSAASPGKRSQSSSKTGRVSRKRAQTTENPSSPDGTETSTAPSTGGGPGTGTSGTDDDGEDA